MVTGFDARCTDGQVSSPVMEVSGCAREVVARLQNWLVFYVVLANDALYDHPEAEETYESCAD